MKTQQIAITPNPTALEYWSQLGDWLPAWSRKLGVKKWEAFCAAVFLLCNATDEQVEAAVKAVRESEE